MREIKFRAWHKEMKLMYRVLSLVLGQREQDASLVRYETTLVRYEGTYVTCRLDEIELMQFTGLTDKHGKDGYAGDLVKLFNRSLFVITWDDDYARYQLELVNGEEIVKIHNMGMLQVGVIIGNMYENPELLTETD